MFVRDWDVRESECPSVMEGIEIETSSYAKAGRLLTGGSLRKSLINQIRMQSR